MMFMSVSFFLKGSVALFHLCKFEKSTIFQSTRDGDKASLVSSTRYYFKKLCLVQDHSPAFYHGVI